MRAIALFLLLLLPGVAYAQVSGPVSITGTATITVVPPPLVSSSPSSLAFGSVTQNASSASQIVTLQNTSTTAAVITGVVLTAQYSYTTNCGGQVAGSSSCTFTVIFSPTALGPAPGTLTISDNSTTTPHVVTVSGTGVASNPAAVALSPSSVSFGSQVQGTTSGTQPITLQNTGGANLSITSIAASSQYNQSNNCPASLAPLGSCTINVSFSPTGVGLVSGSISVTDNATGSPQSVPLSGTGVAGSSNAIPGSLGWFAIPSTNIRTLCPSYAEIQGVSSCPAVMTAWNGGLYDSTRDRLVIFGGGHHDYYGNEIYAINLSANPITKTLVKDSTHNPNMNGVPPACPDAYSDGNPVSRHTYSSLVYIPTTDRYLAYSGARSDCGFFTTASWDFNPATNTWASTGSGPGSTGSQPAAAYDSVTNAVYAIDNNVVELWRYNPTPRTWSDLGGISTICQTTTPSAAIDPVRRLMFCVGGGILSKVSLNSPFTASNLTGTNCSTWKNASAPGIAYYPVQNRIVGWAGGNTAYIYNPDTDTCTTQTFSGGPTTIQANGTYGRFEYSPTSGVFVVANDIDSNVYSLRLDTLTDVDFYNRCHASGVILCNGLDQASDIAGVYGDIKGTVAGDGGAVPTIDSTTFSSGVSGGSHGSLRCDALTLGGTSKCGDFFQSFSSDGTTRLYFDSNSDFYIQWKQRMTTGYVDSGQYKLTNIGGGDGQGCTASTSASCAQTAPTGGTGAVSSCNAAELVTQNTNNRLYPQMYNSCTGSTSHGPFNGFETPFSTAWNSSNFKMQNAMPSPFCLYDNNGQSPLPPTGNCFPFNANEWMTFQIHVHLGTFVTDEYQNSHVDMWVCHEADVTCTQVFNWGPYALSASGGGFTHLRYGKIWLTGYDTTGAVDTGTTRFDELIVSTSRIADPKH